MANVAKTSARQVQSNVPIFPPLYFSTVLTYASSQTRGKYSTNRYNRPTCNEFDWRERERERESTWPAITSLGKWVTFTSSYPRLSGRVAASFLSDDFVLRETNQATLIRASVSCGKCGGIWTDRDIIVDRDILNLNRTYSCLSNTLELLNYDQLGKLAGYKRKRN